VRRAAVAWFGLGCALVLVVAGGVFTARGSGDLTEVAAGFVLVIPFASVGALVSARQADNAIGWLLLGIGLCLALAGACDGAIQYGLDNPGAVAGLGIFALISAAAFSAFFALLFLVLLLLPNGRLLTRRWRFVAGGVALLVAIHLCLVVRPGPFDDWKKEGIRNPLGIGRLEVVTSVLYQAAILLSFLLLLTSLASVVIRFRRSQGVERLQLRWIVTAVAATGLAWVTMIAASAVLGDRHAVDYFWGAAILSISFIPIGIGIAVMRYRLYEIDRLISRTLVYAALTIVLGASYVGLVLAGQALFSSFAGGSNLAIAASTLVVAALFLPVRSRVQRFVDRRFYRRRYDAQRTLERFGARLREQIDLGTLEHDLRGVVTETMRPAHAAIWLRTGARP
jgi:hypothetical protein